MISTNEIYNVLLLEFPYFKKINAEKRQIFCKRTQEFIEGTDFISRKGMVLTNRMQILIAACSQQLTIGFPRHYNYTYFEKVIVYPEKYLSTYTEKYHTGEMNTAGIIVLSWEDFYKGISIDNDTRNVGLHEFAHALEFMDIANKDIDEIFSACLDKFTALADHYLKHQPEIPLFRSYATTNLSEFFAVATEYYFESPKEFAEREPELFDILHKAYQQNSSNISITKKINTNTAGKTYLSDNVSSSNYSSIVSYLIMGAIAATMLYNGIFAGALVLLCFILVMDIFGLQASIFSLYEGYVHVKPGKMRIKQLIQYFFPDRSKYDPIISYSDVLYVNARYSRDDEGGGEFYTYVLCYLQQNKLVEVTCVTTDLNYEPVLRFLYLEKKVGTRLDGKYKKYR